MITTRKRNLLLALIVAAAILGVIFLYAARINSNLERENLGDNLSRIISLYKSGEMSVIDLSSVATFSWDKLYIFGPYTPSEIVNKSLGTIWPEYWDRSIESNEAIILLVFTDKGKVVQYLEYPRGPQCDFTGAQNLDGFNRDDAKFVVDDRERCVPLK